MQFQSFFFNHLNSNNNSKLFVKIRIRSFNATKLPFSLNCHHKEANFFFEILIAISKELLRMQTTTCDCIQLAYEWLLFFLLTINNTNVSYIFNVLYTVILRILISKCWMLRWYYSNKNN